jgi:Bifunctional DNA primase/polymerase, N-terminal
LWRRYPGPLVGVATGPASRSAVLDIDAKHSEAREWWTENRGRLPVTRTHRTRSGGLHLIYADHNGLKCSASKIARGIDVRADGGYVIWWPAVGLLVLSDAAPASWPEWLCEVLAPPAPAPRILHRGARHTSAPLIQSRIEGLLRFVLKAPIGERNARLYWPACRVTDMIRAKDLDSVAGNQALEDLRQIGTATGPLEREVILTITSAYSRPHIGDLDTDHLDTADDLSLHRCEASVEEVCDQGAIESMGKDKCSSVMPSGKLASNASTPRCSLLRLGSPEDAAIHAAISESLGGDGCQGDTGYKKHGW